MLALADRSVDGLKPALDLAKELAIVEGLARWPARIAASLDRSAESSRQRGSDCGIDRGRPVRVQLEIVPAQGEDIPLAQRANPRRRASAAGANA
jgi:hypothetical protein